MELSEEEAASPELTISMPAADVVLAAEYDQNQHQVTINGGSGSGSYLVGETVTLVVDEAEQEKNLPAGKWKKEQSPSRMRINRKQALRCQTENWSSMRFSRISIIRFPSMTGMVPEPTLRGSGAGDGEGFQ